MHEHEHLRNNRFRLSCGLRWCNTPCLSQILFFSVFIPVKQIGIMRKMRFGNNIIHSCTAMNQMRVTFRVEAPFLWIYWCFRCFFLALFFFLENESFIQLCNVHNFCCPVSICIYLRYLCIYADESCWCCYPHPTVQVHSYVLMSICSEIYFHRLTFS